MWLKSAKTVYAALDGNADDPEFYRAKLVTAQFFMTRLLPRAAGLGATIRAGKDSMMAPAEAAF